MMMMSRQSLTLVSHCLRRRRIVPLHIRLFSSNFIHLDSNEYTSALYTKLSLQDQYEFLDRKVPLSDLTRQDTQLAASQAFREFLNILVDEAEVTQGGTESLRNIQREFCEKFTSWSKVAQLKIGFLLYLDSRIEADDYLLKVIKHMAAGNIFDAGPHDLTALMLLIYFKRDLNLEDLSEFIDVDLLMSAFAIQLRSKGMSRDEICACCLGLKRISGLSITNISLRKELYSQLQAFSCSASPDGLDDFFIVTLMVTLYRGSLVFKDDVQEVDSMMRNLQKSINDFKLETAIKVLCYPRALNFGNRVVEESVLSRAETELDSLTGHDCLSLANYVSKSRQPEARSFIPRLVDRLETTIPGIAGLHELADLVESFHYISHTAVHSQLFNRALFLTLAGVAELQKGFSIEEVSREIAHGLASNLGLENLELDWTQVSSKQVAVFSRIASFICSSYQVESGHAVPSVSPSVLFSLSSYFHKQLPIQLYSPAMDIKKLDLRTKQLVTCYRMVAKLLGNEQFCRVVRILPHFDEPDIVFGNIGGMCMTVPSYLWEPGLQGPRKPPPGDWHVLVIGTRKSLNLEGQVVGQAVAKLAQLEKLGYTPVILPYKDLGSAGSIMKALTRVLTSADVILPNLDDGVHERTRRF